MCCFARSGTIFTIQKTLKPVTLLEITLLHGCFSRFLNCKNGTKLRNASHISELFLQMAGDLPFYLKFGVFS